MPLEKAVLSWWPSEAGLGTLQISHGREEIARQALAKILPETIAVATEIGKGEDSTTQEFGRQNSADGKERGSRRGEKFDLAGATPSSKEKTAEEGRASVDLFGDGFIPGKTENLDNCLESARWPKGKTLPSGVFLFCGKLTVMKLEEAVRYWQEGAARDLQTAKDLLKMEHRHWALFLYHLCLEKSLKARISQHGQEIPYTHDLSRLAKEAGLTLGQELSEQLNEITTFNLEARYDDYKQAFYRKATREYAERWAKVCEEIYLWVGKQK